MSPKIVRASSNDLSTETVLRRKCPVCPASSAHVQQPEGGMVNMSLCHGLCLSASGWDQVWLITRSWGGFKLHIYRPCLLRYWHSRSGGKLRNILPIWLYADMHIDLYLHILKSYSDDPDGKLGVRTAVSANFQHLSTAPKCQGWEWEETLLVQPELDSVTWACWAGEYFVVSLNQPSLNTLKKHLFAGKADHHMEMPQDNGLLGQWSVFLSCPEKLSFGPKHIGKTKVLQ